jgi:hypothetical protein
MTMKDIGAGPAVTKWRIEKLGELECITKERATRYLVSLGWARYMDALLANALPEGHPRSKFTKDEAHSVATPRLERPTAPTDDGA